MRRLSRESGFTLVELLIVLVVIGVLLAIAVPSYLGFRERAADSAAKAIVRAAVPAAVAYATDNVGRADDADRNAATTGFEGMTRARMRTYDRGIPTSLTIHGASSTPTGFCLRATVNGRTWSVAGPGASDFKNNNRCR